MRPFPWFGKSRARDALHALSGRLPEDPTWLDGERAEKEANDIECVFCGDKPDSESLPNGRIRLILSVCPEHVQLAARRTLARKFAELSDSVREKLER